MENAHSSTLKWFFFSNVLFSPQKEKHGIELTSFLKKRGKTTNPQLWSWNQRLFVVKWMSTQPTSHYCTSANLREIKKQKNRDDPKSKKQKGKYPDSESDSKNSGSFNATQDLSTRKSLPAKSWWCWGEKSLTIE